MISKLCAFFSSIILPLVFRLEYLPYNLILLIKSQYFGRMNFATFWSILLTNVSCVLYLLQTISSYFPWTKNTYSNRLLKISMSISYPLAIIVTVVYWCIIFIDRSLIYPAALKIDRIAIWREFTLHLFPIVILSIIKKAVLINVSIIYILTFCIIYASMNFYSFFKTSNWPYAIMSKLSIIQNLFLHFVLGLLILMLFIKLRSIDNKKLRDKKLTKLRIIKNKNK